MNSDTLALIALILAAIPAVLFGLSLLVYRPLTHRPGRLEHSVSVLIPARHEERNIRRTLEAVLANRGLDFEVVVLDDHSMEMARAGTSLARAARGMERPHL